MCFVYLCAITYLLRERDREDNSREQAEGSQVPAWAVSHCNPASHTSGRLLCKYMYRKEELRGWVVGVKQDQSLWLCVFYRC